ncbi:hypothetical protein PGTUg99_018354 [Puccinia graminis f. sp. tritici]|uniref:Uncharacterized protein n=1 Tax=Puccinia graminis f. sp. tritici TaxID=56615 RepID=A0A5B0NB58_PUCGR|nr:hypothetical protein PGTUg99_015264 [Puccinia graminis f. sp. tritici]KAA1105148.1 hypothetical protein PGTUg99_018354 [Puccinia graminis f. sp. tritici]
MRCDYVIDVLLPSATLGVLASGWSAGRSDRGNQSRLPALVTLCSLFVPVFMTHAANLRD